MCINAKMIQANIMMTCNPPAQNDLRKRYATNYEGAQFLRPYMLAFRKDTGCSGLIEPETALRVMEAIMVEGLLGLFWDVCTLYGIGSNHGCRRSRDFIAWLPRFLSDADLPGIEKVNVTQIPKEFLDQPYPQLPATFGGALFCNMSVS